MADPGTSASNEQPRSFLDRAVAGARLASDRRAGTLPLEALQAMALGRPGPRPLRDALAGPGVSLIAEVKRRSPSRGAIAPDLDAVALSQAYRAGGAAAVSVLTEPEHFGGSPADLESVAAAVDLPVLRKDFVTTAYQVWEARAWGSAGVLLIVAALGPGHLAELLTVAHAVGIDCLVEVHDEREAATAAEVGATLVGVNARDLRTLEVDPRRFAGVRGALPGDIVVVAESGIASRADVERAAAAGADAVLVGEHLVRAPDPAAAVRELLGAAYGTSGLVTTGAPSPAMDRGGARG